MMPQEEPKNRNPETDNTDEEDSDTQTTPYAEKVVPDGGEISAPGEMQTATEQAAADETPLPTTQGFHKGFHKDPYHTRIQPQFGRPLHSTRKPQRIKKKVKVNQQDKAKKEKELGSSHK